MKKRRKKKQSRELVVAPQGFDDVMTLEEFRKDIRREMMPPNTRLYVDVGGPMLKALYLRFYPSGIEGKPSLILSIEKIDDPKHTPFERTLASQMIEFLRTIARAKDK